MAIYMTKDIISNALEDKLVLNTGRNKIQFSYKQVSETNT